MTKKEWLNRGWKIEKELKALENEKQRLFDLATKVTAPTDAERISSTKINSSEETFINYSDYSKLIDKKINELILVKKEVAQAIYTVKNSTYRTLLIERYINYRKWEEIAVDTDYTFQWVHILHNKALKEINILQIIDCN